VTELYFKKLAGNEQAIKDEISRLEFSENVLVIRSGLDLLDLAGWHNFLRSHPQLQEDRRHFNFDSNLDMADWWEISYQPDYSSSYAYSNTRQPLHCDNAWFADGAEINFFAMKRQAHKGGEQTIYPLSRLVEDLMKQEPSLLDDLLAVPVKIKKGESGYEHLTTVIKNIDSPKCYWNFYRTEKDNRDIAKMCDSFFKFLEDQEKTPSVYRVRCNTGDCMAFNDSLILHGREAFAATEPYDRVLYQSMWKIK
jgi:hypothetical protein